MTNLEVPLSRRRLITTLILVVVPAIAIGLSYILWASTLDENLAFHWDASGRVDGLIATTPVFVFAQTVAIAGAALGVIFLLLPRARWKSRREATFWSGTLSGAAMAFWLVPAGLTHATGDAQQTDLGPWLILLAAFFFYGALIRTAVPAVVDAGRDPDAELPAGFGPTRWTARVVSVPALTAGVLSILALGAGVLGAAGIFGGQSADVWVITLLAAAAAAAALATLALVVVRVTISARGLEIRSGVLGFPLKTVRLQQIQNAEAESLRPQEWGGWGIRRRGSDTAFIVHGSDVLRVQKTDGSSVFVTVPDPGQPARALQELTRGRR
jgi:hypothetical protein